MQSKLTKKDNILVTGAGGVLGTAVLQEFRKHNYDNLFFPNSGELDLINTESLCAYLKKHKISVVIHLASKVYGLLGNINNQVEAISKNTLINDSVFTALIQFPVRHLFFSGTVASYPYPYPNIPLTESDFFMGLPHEGEFGYAMAKRHGYACLKLLAKETGARCLYGIFTNLYGPNDRFDLENGHVIPSLIAKAHQCTISNKSFKVWGNGMAIRDFLYSADAARALRICLESHDNLNLINISSGVGVSIKQLAEIIASEAGIKNIIFEHNKPTGIPERIVDNSRLNQLGFYQQVSLESGLALTYRWYAENIEEIRI